jgi:rSAM/selenodomain-associated transferase 2
VEPKRRSEIGVVVPVCREPAVQVERCLAAAEAAGPAQQVIVVGCEPDEELAQAARRGRARFIVAPRGRAAQMNRGVATLDDDVDLLLFLHVDTRLPAGWPSEVRRLLQLGAAVGAFRFQLDRGGLAVRVIETGVALRNRWARTPYGDQALFLRRETFEKLGGYGDLRFMEDLDLVTRAKDLGPIAISPLPARTSARRWERAGYLRTTLRNWSLAGAWACGWRPRPRPDPFERWVERNLS